MKSRPVPSSLFVLPVLLLIAVAGLAYAQEPETSASRALQAPLGTFFTYQGQLKMEGEPVNDTCELAFRLYDDATAGNQIGAAITETVAVSDGLFTQPLDFGVGAFDGDARWLGIRVRCSGEADFTPLGRQALAATPYALYAKTAENAHLLDGQPASAFADDMHTHAGSDITSSVATATLALSSTHTSWSGLTGVPAGFADEIDDDTLGGLVCVSGQMPVWDNGSWTCGNTYARIVVVSPVGTPTENGTALLNALASITDASESNPYLLKIEPGVYDVGSTSVSMLQYVDVEGSGENVTKITGAGGTLVHDATVRTANYSELRFLTVENTGGADWATAIYCSSGSPKITHVTALASGGTAWSVGVFLNSSSAVLVDVTASASGESENRGVANHAASSATLIDVRATTVGGTMSYAVRNTNLSDLTMIGGTASASGATGTNTGVYQEDRSSMLLRGVIISASGGTTSHGLHNAHGSAEVQDSQVSGDTHTVLNNSGVTTRVGSSQLAGGAVSGGTAICAGVYDENYTFYTSTCP